MKDSSGAEIPSQRALSVDEQKEIWKKEQLRVASKVVIYPDNYEDKSTALNANRFRLVRMTNGNLDRPRYRQQKEDNQDKEEKQPQGKKTNHYYGGVDVSFPENENDNGVAVYVIIDSTTMEVIYQDYEYFPVNDIPYISSYLAFREIKPLERLIAKQKQNRSSVTPCVILVDGNGIFHTRKAGIACFVGVTCNIPTIGIGKTLYCIGGLEKKLVQDGIRRTLESIRDTIVVSSSSPQPTKKQNVIIMDQQCIHGSNSSGGDGTCDENNSSSQNNATTSGTVTADDSNSNHQKITNKEPIEKGDSQETLMQKLAPSCCGVGIPLSVNDDREILACALVGHGGRSVSSKQGKQIPVGTKNPIYISVGHQMSLLEAVQISASLSIARIPEPVRQADLIGREMLRQKQLQKQQQYMGTK